MPPVPPPKDLFDDTTMTFGEHLEVLRVHLLRALLGLLIGVAISLYFSQRIIVWIQAPVIASMKTVFGEATPEAVKIKDNDVTLWTRVKRTVGLEATPPAAAPQVGTHPVSPPSPEQGTTATKTAADPNTKSAQSPPSVVQTPVQPGTTGGPDEQPNAPVPNEPVPGLPPLMVEIDAREIARQLHAAMPTQYPPVPESTPPAVIRVPVEAQTVKQLRSDLLDVVFKENMRARTDGPDEAFMIYIKVSLVVGLLISSPWIIYQIWLFVAAGLYPHERHYVYKYLPMSTFLFVGGALFAFFAVIPFVLNFLFGFNAWLELRPEMKIGTWLTFAMTISLMFGISFQLPLVMVFLEKISIFEVKQYRDQRRMAILVITFLSMILTPSDPVSMILMMVPLIILYEVGIWLCSSDKSKNPFGEQPAPA